VFSPLGDEGDDHAAAARAAAAAGAEVEDPHRNARFSAPEPENGKAPKSPRGER
jgi:hypothetical protein